MQNACKWPLGPTPKTHDYINATQFKSIKSNNTLRHTPRVVIPKYTSIFNSSIIAIVIRMLALVLRPLVDVPVLAARRAVLPAAVLEAVLLVE